jgi:hypothetical protein
MEFNFWFLFFVKCLSGFCVSGGKRKSINSGMSRFLFLSGIPYSHSWDINAELKKLYKTSAADFSPSLAIRDYHRILLFFHSGSEKETKAISTLKNCPRQPTISLILFIYKYADAK